MHTENQKKSGGKTKSKKVEKREDQRGAIEQMTRRKKGKKGNKTTQKKP